MARTKKNLSLAEIAQALTPEQINQLLSIKTQDQEKAKAREDYKSRTETELKKAIAILQEAEDALVIAKTRIYKEFSELVADKKQLFEAEEPQKSHTFSTETEGMTIGFNEVEGWDDTAAVGVEKITRFLETLAKDETSAALVTTIMRLLKKTRAGNLRATAVLELEKLQEKFHSPEFADGVKILREAYKTVPSCWFVKAWTVDKQGKRRDIKTSISSVEFPPEFDFKGF